MENFPSDVRVMECGGDGVRRATRRAGDDGTAGDGDATAWHGGVRGDGDATRHGGAAGDGPHAGKRLFSDVGCACSIVSNRCDFISDEIGRFCYHNRMVKRSVRTRRCVDGHSARPA